MADNEEQVETAVAIARLEGKVEEILGLLKGNGVPGVLTRLYRVEMGMARRLGWVAGVSTTASIGATLLAGWIKGRLLGHP